MSSQRCETQAISHADVLDGSGIGSLSLAAKDSKTVKEEREIQDVYSLFADPVSPFPPFVPPGTGPCSICSGPHSRSFCAWQFSCPLNAKVCKNYKVLCVCGSDVINDDKCGKGCSSTSGLAVHKDFKPKSFLAVGKRFC